MSDTVPRTDYDRLSSQFAALQRENEQYRKRAAIDPQSLLMNPLGTLRANGYTDDHIEHFRSVLLADKLGAQAPLHMQMAASQGPTMVALQQVMATVKELADKVNATSTVQSVTVERDKFKSIIADKSKYPHLAKAYANNPSKFSEGLQSGTAEDYAKKLEEQFTDVLGPAPKDDAKTDTASANAETGAQSTKSGANVSAHSGLLNGNVPVPQSKSTKEGVWSKDTYESLRDQIVAETAKLVTPI